MNEMRCGGCGSREIAEGFFIDRGHGNTRQPLEWGEGVPEKTFWLGMKPAGTVLPVTGLRCNQCGRLELYAPEAPQ